MSDTFGPYSPLRQTGSHYFVSGQVGVDPHTKSAPSDSVRQATQALDNLRALLESHGLTMDNVVKTTIFLTNMDDFAAVNDIYMTYFSDPRPARTTVGVKALPQIGSNPLLIEIEALAYKGEL